MSSKKRKKKRRRISQAHDQYKAIKINDGSVLYVDKNTTLSNEELETLSTLIDDEHKRKKREMQDDSTEVLEMRMNIWDKLLYHALVFAAAITTTVRISFQLAHSQTNAIGWKVLLYLLAVLALPLTCSIGLLWALGLLLSNNFRVSDNPNISEDDSDDLPK